MRITNAERLIKGLAERGYIVNAVSVYIHRWHGQPMLNKAAGEAAPTWALKVNPAWRFGKVFRTGDDPQVIFPDGQQLTVEVCSHIPLTHTLKYSASSWEITLDDYSGSQRLVVDAPDLPPHW